MEIDELFFLDPNTADLDTLLRLPGMSTELAQRIIDSRPYAVIEDLQKVRGLGLGKLARWQPYWKIDSPPSIKKPSTQLTVESDPEPADAVISQQPFADKAETFPIPSPDQESSPEPSTEPVSHPIQANSTPVDPEHSPSPTAHQPIHTPAVSAPSSPPRQSGFSRFQALILQFFGNLATLLIALGIIASLNAGHLQFVLPNQASQLALRLDDMESRATALERDLDSLNQRMQKIETQAGRISELEKQTAGLRSELGQTGDRVELLSTGVISLTEQFNGVATQVNIAIERVDALEQNSQRTNTFLEGLRTLLDGLFGGGSK